MEKAGTAHISYVFAAPFHFIVLTRKDNTWDNEMIDRYVAVLDEIEATKGPGVLVTIGTGDKHFSTGFDLLKWVESFENVQTSICNMSKIHARLLSFPMPTMCVFNGNAIAGGYILGLAHDFRIMHETVGTICLSELKLGIPLPASYMSICAAKLQANVCNKIAFGASLDQSEALKDGLIDDTYASVEQLQQKLSAFAKKYAAIGEHRAAVKTNKMNQFAATIAACREFTEFSPIYRAYKLSIYENFKRIVAQMQLAK